MVKSPQMHRLVKAAAAAEDLLARLCGATERGIEALRSIDTTSLDAALEERESLLPRSAAAFEELETARRVFPPEIPDEVRAAMSRARLAAARCQALDLHLNVALSAVREQTRVELAGIDGAGSRGRKYRSEASSQRSTLDITR